MKWVLSVIALVLAGCATPAKVQTSLEFERNTVILKIKNQEARATTPLLIRVTLQFREAGKWGQPSAAIHPAAFVLKGNEEQILRSMVKMTGDAVKATLTIKEQETDRVLSTQEIEKPLKT